MSIAPRPEVAGLGPCPHGAISDAELAAAGRPVLDFSVNSNPLGPSPLALQALSAVDVSRYPDPEALALRSALSDGLGLPLASIIVGNGSAELIWLVALAYLRPGDGVLVLGPAFGEYERAARIMGAPVTVQAAHAADGFRPPVTEAIGHIERHRPRVIFLCNPNNPTGTYLGRHAVEELLAACRHSLLVVDEAYLPFLEEPDSLLDLLGPGNLLLLRSMTKDGALAGLRLGYAVAASPVVSALTAVRPPWSANAAALAVGLASWGDTDHLARSRRAVSRAREYLFQQLTGMGLRVYPSVANFLLVDVSTGRLPGPWDGQSPAARWRSALLRRGCCVRDCSSFGLPDCIRIGIRVLPDCEVLVAAMREMMADG